MIVALFIVIEEVFFIVTFLSTIRPEYFLSIIWRVCTHQKKDNLVLLHVYTLSNWFQGFYWVLLGFT